MNENIFKFLTLKENVAYISTSSTIRQAIERFRAHGFKTVPVLNEDGTYAGVLSEGDLLWAIIDDDALILKELEDKSIKNIIKNSIKPCKTDASLEEIINVIINHNFVPIVDDRNVLMGIITRKTIINYLLEK